MWSSLQAGSRRAACLVVLLLILSGCAPLRDGGVPVGAGREFLRLEGVPFHPQDAFQCGPAALAMAMSWAGRETKPEEIAPLVYTPGRKGSLQPALLGAARRHGLLAYPVAGEEAAFSELAAGHPVIILQNLAFSWYPRWHYAVLVGYDLPAGRVFLHTGHDEYAARPRRVFNNTWKRSGSWGLVVLPPEVLPATAREIPYLEAALGLEQAGRPLAAMEAYRSAVGRWPESLGAWMGLGNAAYAGGEPAEAESAFRQAVELHPEAGAAWNNLAQVLWERGKREEAAAAIRQAVALGGAMQPFFLETMRLIEGGPEAQSHSAEPAGDRSEHR
jgi:hypothetical protein